MSVNDWTELAGAVGVFTLATVIISIAIVQLAATARAKATLAREEGYRKLAETAAQTQQAIERHLTALADQSEQTRQRLTAIERILADVE